VHIKNIKKDYGQMSKIWSYHIPFDARPPVCKLHEQPACPICWVRKVSPVPRASSLIRSKVKITDYVLSNEFDLFCTFTYDPQKVDSFDVEQAKLKMSTWLKNARKISPDLKYIIVAEQHKSGRIHFHALFGNYLGVLVSAQRSKNGREIYNISNWRFGFSTATYIANKEKVSSYVQKYITKDMLKFGNKKRYWASRNLRIPEKTYNVSLLQEVYSRPLFISGRHTTESYTVFTTIPVDKIEKPKHTKKHIKPRRKEYAPCGRYR